MTIIGFHISRTGGHRGELGAHMRDLDAVGIPFCINAVDDAGLALEAAGYTNASHIILFHLNRWTGAPDYNATAESEGTARWQHIKDDMPPELEAVNDRIILEVAIEPDKNRADWLGRFFVAVAKAAKADGWRVAGPSFSAGEPEPEHWETPGMLEWLRYCGENQRQAWIAQHEYSLDADDITAGSPWHIGRIREPLAVCDANDIPHPNIVISECGWAHNDMPDSGVMEQVAWLHEHYSQYPAVKGLCLWTLGAGSQWGILPEKLSAYVDDVTQFMLDNYEPVEEPEEPEEPMDEKELEQYIWERMNEHQREHGINVNPTFGLNAFALEMIEENPGLIFAYTESTMDTPNGAVGHVKLEHVTGEIPSVGLWFKRPWSGPGGVKMITDPDARLFEAPVGTVEERRAGLTGPYGWPGKWKDSTGFATRYKLKTTNNPDGIYQRHSGADLNLNDPGWNADKGLPAYAMGDGVVVFAERVPAPSTWGRVVVIRHELPPGLGPVEVVHSRYAHLGSLLVQAGQKVKRGDVVGVIGGAEFGLSDHLHFDISHSGILESKPLHWTFDNLNEVLKHYLDPREFLLGKADALVEPAQLQAGPAGTVGLVGSLQANAASQHYPYRERALSGIQYVVIHHSAGNPANPSASIAEGHINRNGGGVDGWPGIGYHYYITGNGQIYRTQRLEMHSFHAGQVNGASVGVCLAGSFMDGAMPTLAQLASCRALVDWLKARLPADVEIKKHRDFAATTCPGETWPSWWRAATGQEPPTPAIDLLPYLRGDGRLYEVRNAVGSQERFQIQHDGNVFYQTKNSQWEMLFYDDQFIYRDVDTSPGGGRFYRLLEDGQPGSRWIPRHWSPGQEYTRSRRVQFYDKATCEPVSENSGDVTDTIRFIARHSTYTFRTGITLPDVVELEWANGPERYFYARGYGLVGWERLHQDPDTPQWSAISEIHEPGARLDNEREEIGCL